MEHWVCFCLVLDWPDFFLVVVGGCREWCRNVHGFGAMSESPSKKFLLRFKWHVQRPLRKTFGHCKGEQKKKKLLSVLRYGMLNSYYNVQTVVCNYAFIFWNKEVFSSKYCRVLFNPFQLLHSWEPQGLSLQIFKAKKVSFAIRHIMENICLYLCIR